MKYSNPVILITIQLKKIVNYCRDRRDKHRGQGPEGRGMQEKKREEKVWEQEGPLG